MSPLRFRILGIALLLFVALVCYAVGVTVPAEVFLAGVLLEFCFWAVLLLSDWRGLRKASADQQS